MVLELEHYSDNILMYTDKWNELKFSMSDSLEEIINNDLKIIENSGNENAEKFYANAFAYALKGKVLVANFWFTGCTPCKEEIPELNKLAEKYKDCVFLVFSLDENKSQLKRFLAKYPFRFNIIPGASEIAGKFQIKSYPSTIVISPEGNIYHFEVGGPNNIRDVLSVKIEELLKK